MEQCALEERTRSKKRMVQEIEIGRKGTFKKKGEASRGGGVGERKDEREEQRGWGKKEREKEVA